MGGARAAAGGELGVEDVEGVGGDLGHVDIAERSQIAGDDAAVLLERVQWPAALLDRDPLGGEVAEGTPGVGGVLRTEVHFPSVGLMLGLPPVASPVFVAQRLVPMRTEEALDVCRGPLTRCATDGGWLRGRGRGLLS
jgi:hypothetical protein